MSLLQRLNLAPAASARGAATAAQAPALRKVTITPRNPDMTLGSSVRFRATGHYADRSTRDITDQVTWTSSDPKKLTIDANGLATPGLVSGNPLVRGMDPDTGLADATTVYVDMPSVKDLVVTPLHLRVAKGQSLALTATASFHGGGTMKVNDWLQWTPVDPGIASVASGGSHLQGHAEGETTIEVVEPGSGLTDILVVTVLPPALTLILIDPPDPTMQVGQRQRFGTTGFYSDVTSAALVKPTWRSSAPDVAAIDPSGEAIAKAAGTATITVTDRTTGVSASVEVTVAP